MVLLQSKVNFNRMIAQSILKQLPQTNSVLTRKTSLDLHSDSYEAPYLLEKELELIKDYIKQTRDEIGKLSKELDSIRPAECDEKLQYKKTELVEENLLITVIPSFDALRADINAAIRSIKTMEFYMKNITQKAIVYWGWTGDDIAKFLKHENIKLIGTSEMKYFVEDRL